MIVRGGLQLGAADSTFCQIASGCLHNEVKRTMAGGGTEKKKKNRKRGMLPFVVSETDTAPLQSEKQQEPQCIGTRK